MLIDEAVSLAEKLIDSGLRGVSIKYDARLVSWKVTIEENNLFKKELKTIISLADEQGLEVELKIAEMEFDIYTPVGKPSE